MMLHLMLLIAFSLVFIINGWKHSGGIQNENDYILGTKPLGLSLGMVTILAYWITGNTLLSAPEATYNNGVLGDLGYAFLGTIGLLLFAPVAKILKTKHPDVRSIGDFYAKKYQCKPLALFVVSLVIIHSLGILLTQGIGAGLLLQYSFHIPYPVAVFLVFFVATIYIIFGGFQSIVRVGMFQLIFILGVALFIPPLLFLKIGVVEVYQSIKVYAPDKINILNEKGLMFLLSGLFIGFGAVIMDNFFWQRTYQSKKQGVATAFILSASVWVFIPLAFGSLAYIALAHNIQADKINQLIPLVVDRFGGSFANSLLLLAVWSALISTTAILLNSVSGLVVYNVFAFSKRKRRPLKEARWSIIIFASLGFGFSLFPLTSMLEIMMFLAVINSAMIFPTLISLFSVRISSICISVTILIPGIIGIFTYFYKNEIQGILLSAFLSFILSLLTLSFSYWNQKQHSQSDIDEIKEEHSQPTMIKETKDKIS
jgi:Na+/proline symporter